MQYLISFEALLLYFTKYITIYFEVPDRTDHMKLERNWLLVSGFLFPIVTVVEEVMIPDCSGGNQMSQNYPAAAVGESTFIP